MSNVLKTHILLVILSSDNTDYSSESLLHQRCQQKHCTGTGWWFL